MSRLILAIFALTASQAWASGSVIGNGGDPLFYFLEATRYSLTETIRGFNEKERGAFCESAKLSRPQIDLCRRFFFAVSDEVLRLNSGAAKTKFVLREQTLLVDGPDGRPMPVAARTALGPLGEVEFHRDSIQVMAPSQILFLMAHEFGHKATFDGRNVTDNESIGDFATGRELIDSMAAAFVESAKRLNKVGSQYGLRDNFECFVLVNGSRFGVRTSSPRTFMDTSLMAYETSLSRMPTDSMVFVPETNISDLVFRAVIMESANCAEGSPRRTELSIVRQFRPPSDREEEPVVSQTLDGVNPLCEKTRVPLQLSYGNANFSCQYFGTQGTTSMNVTPLLRGLRPTSPLFRGSKK